VFIVVLYIVYILSCLCLCVWNELQLVSFSSQAALCSTGGRFSTWRIHSQAADRRWPQPIRQPWDVLQHQVSHREYILIGISAYILPRVTTSSPAVAWVGRPYCLHPKASIRHPVVERKRFPWMTAFPYTLFGNGVTLLSRMLQATLYRVRQKSGPLKFFAVFSATISNFNLKFYTFVY